MAESVHSGGEGGKLSIQTAAEPEEASLLTFINIYRALTTRTLIVLERR